MTLTEFLLARIAEDEAATRRSSYLHVHGTHMAYRQRAECEAKRRIVEYLGHTAEHEMGWDGMDWFVLEHLATVYADHPDYDEDWRP